MNDSITVEKKKSPYTLPRIAFYKLIWIFVISSIIGVVVETVFCYIFKGYLECRQGVLYGPFNQVYGFGSVVLAFALLHIKQKGIPTVFCVSALIGGLFETICSYVQEYLFGSVSWDYKWMPISLFGGRTNILYMVFFGFLGVVFIYLCFPLLSKLGDRIYRGKGIPFTWLVVAFMTVNLALSAIVVARWTERQDQMPPANRFESFLDTHYPDDMLDIIFPTMKITK